MSKISNPSDRMKVAHQLWELPDDLWQGTKALREKSHTYLPQEPAEKLDNYRLRVNRSVLFNAYKRTITNNAGRVFENPVIINEETPEIIDQLFSDIDLCGQSIDQFGKNQLITGMRHGISYIFVDYPKIPTGYTAYDEKQHGVRPYWTLITGPQVLDFKAEYIGGAQKLTYFKFIEFTEEYETTGTHTVGTKSVNVPEQHTDSRGYLTSQGRPVHIPTETNQIKEFMLEDGAVNYKVYRKKMIDDKEGQSYDWKEVEHGTMQGFTHIPIVPFYANRTQYMLGEPVFDDLAEVNLTHFQSYSDQRNILHTARVPMLFLRDIGEEVGPDGSRKPREIVISPNSTIVATGEHADAKWIEHSGEAIKSGEEDLAHLENMMTVLGLELHATQKSGNPTATEKVLDTASSHSLLMSMVYNLEDALNNAVEITAQMMGIKLPEGLSVIELNKEYSTPFHNDKDMEQLYDLWRDGLITAGDLLEEAKRRNILRSKYEIADDIANKEYEEPQTQVRMVQDGAEPPEDIPTGDVNDND